MQATLSNDTPARCFLRLSERSLNIAYTDGAEEPRIHHTIHALNPGVDQAHQVSAILDKSETGSANHCDATLLVNGPVLLIPADEYDAETAGDLYDHTFTGHEKEEKISVGMEQLSCIAVFSLDKATHTMLEERFSHLHIYPCEWPVWLHFQAIDQHLHRNPLYGYFHDGCLDIFRFQHDRLRFFNRFEVEQAPDALYFLLNVWRQLGMDAETDHMVLVGEQPAELKERLERHLRHISVNAPAIDTDDEQTTSIADIPYDLLLMQERLIKH